MGFESTTCRCFLALLAFVHVAYGQTVTVTGPTDVEQGNNAVFACTLTGGDPSSSIFFWRDESTDTPVTIFFGDTRNSPIPDKYANFSVSVNGATSTMTITDTVIGHEGRYRCEVGTVRDEIILSVEVAHTYSLDLDVADPLVEDNMYSATCDAIDGRPNVTITWRLGDNTSPCNSIEQTLPAPVDLFSKRSVCTFKADRANNGDELRCIINGHQIPSLNGEQSSTLNIEYAPVNTSIMTVDFQVQVSNLTVTCNIAENNQPNPRITYYYIIANNSVVIHQSTSGVNSKEIEQPAFVTDFRCEAGNYLGNTTATAPFDPTRPPTPTTPTEPSTPEGFITVTPNPAVQTTESSPMAGDNATDRLSGDTGLSAGEIAGIAIGAILAIVIIVIVIVFFLKKGSGGSSSSGVSAKKHTSSTVGTSNGSEKEKIKPVAAPRDQGSIQHTTDNPGQAEYAMVDRKKSGGGDMPDTRGPSHDSPGMHYADLDLSTNAGHTERQVPQNPDNVVVYSSILV